MKYEETKKNIKVAYALINDAPVDRLDCINKALKILTVLAGGMAFLNELATSPHLHEYTNEELEYVHESFCDSATPILQMVEHFADKREKAAQKYSLAV